MLPKELLSLSGKWGDPRSKEKIAMHRRALLVAFLLACAATATPVVADNLIVPGVRIGPVRIGMTAEELYRVMGDPVGGQRNVFGGVTTATQRTADGMLYNFPGLSVFVLSASGRVQHVEASDSTFSTREGLAVDNSELALRAKLGAPEKRKTINEDDFSFSTTVYWYKARSLEVGVLNRSGLIYYIRIWPRG